MLEDEILQRPFNDLETGVDFEVNTQQYEHPYVEQPWTRFYTLRLTLLLACCLPNRPHRSPENFLLHLRQTTSDVVHDVGCRFALTGLAKVFNCRISCLLAAYVRFLEGCQIFCGSWSRLGTLAELKVGLRLI